MLYALSGSHAKLFECRCLPIAAPSRPSFRGERVVCSTMLPRIPATVKSGRTTGWPKGPLPCAAIVAAPVVSRSGEFWAACSSVIPRPARFTETQCGIMPALPRKRNRHGTMRAWFEPRQFRADLNSANQRRTAARHQRSRGFCVFRQPRFAGAAADHRYIGADSGTDWGQHYRRRDAF